MQQKKRIKGKKNELKVTFHQLQLCAKAYFFLKTPWHFCYGAFFLSPCEISYSIHLCACAQLAYKVCVLWVCVCVPDWYLLCVRAMFNLVNWSSMWSGLSMDWCTELVMSSVTSLSLYYRLNLLYFHPISKISVPSGCN